MPRMRWRPGRRPGRRWGSLRRSPRPLSRLGRVHPSPRTRLLGGLILWSSRLRRSLLSATAPRFYRTVTHLFF